LSKLDCDSRNHVIGRNQPVAEVLCVQQPEVPLIRGVGAKYGSINHHTLWPISRTVVRGAYPHFWKPVALLASDRARVEITSSGKVLPASDQPNEVVSILHASSRHQHAPPSRLLDPQLDEIELRFDGSTPFPGSMTTGVTA